MAEPNIEQRMDVGDYRPIAHSFRDPWLTTGCWRCPGRNDAPVNGAFLCEACTEELRG